MPGPSGSVRRPAVAGMFYPASDESCTAAAAELISANESARGSKWIGAIVPHAGWICSGAIAGEAIGTLASSAAPDVVVVFGAVHTPIPLERAVLASHARWIVPGGESDVPAEISAKVQEGSSLLGIDDRFHEREHAVEVELPLIQRVWPSAKLLPIEVPLIEEAVEIGKATARAMIDAKLSAVYLASSDLTHYGPSYRFAPAGVGMHGLAWALENDRRLLDVVTSFAPEQIVPEVRARMNACGGGAIAAMLAASREHGAKTVNVLRHANSFQTLRNVAPQTPDNAVGYAAVVVG